MLQNFANYLLGSVLSQDPEPTAQGVETNKRLISRMQEEDGWILVDRDSEGNSDDASSVESLEFHPVNRIENSDKASPSQITRTSSLSSLPCTSNMEESWFLTPPPCFTSAGPIHVETSPLENLLIEHPSMSVYQHTQPNRRVLLRSVSSSPVMDELVVDNRREGQEEVAIVRRIPCRNGTQLMYIQQRQYSKNKQAQKVQIQKASVPLKKANLERSNKAREVNCRNQRQRRGERSQGAKRSYANNNRKC